MKKFFISLLAFSVFSGTLFAKQWTNNIGAGMSIPFSTIGVNKNGADDINQLGYGVEGTYIGQHENGFIAKANVSIGLATSKDISVQERNTNLGVFENVALGIGYSFVNTERALFGLAGMAGVELGQYSLEEEKNSDSIETSYSLVTVSFGTDIFSVYKISERIGFFANLNARWIIAGTARREVTTESKNNGKKKQETDSSSTDLLGKFIVQPSIGVIWSF